MKISKWMDGQEEKVQIVISVRNLVEFLLTSGDIDESTSGRMHKEAMQEGNRIHKKLQKREGSNYHAEIPLKFILSYDDYDLALEGRADGIIFDDDVLDDHDEDITVPAQVMIDEIKGMYLDVGKLEKALEVHEAQAKCYGYIFLMQHQLEEIDVRITYCNLDTEEIKRFQREYKKQELETWFLDLMEKYKKWADFLYQQKKKRFLSIEGLEFPFPYRQGQKKVVEDVYRSIIREKILFLQAPTGTGKTLATIFPAVQAVGQGIGDKIFYLTAKNAAAVVARDTFLLLEEKGYQGKTVVITAKDKMCPLENRSCNPTDCIYAKGHYDRVNDAVYDLLHQKNMMDRESIIAFAMERKVCPFEFCLDLSSWVDHIICDYNYVFDPTVALKRFFTSGIKGDYIFLIDEAHNMVDRAREMYSENIIKEEVLRVKKILKPYGKKLERTLERCNKELLALKRNCEHMLVLEEMDAFLFSLYAVASTIDDLLQRENHIEQKEDILEFYFRIRNFINLSEFYDEHYKIYCDYNERDEFVLHLFCADPSLLLQERLNKARASVYFSATLLPVNYYKELLCSRSDIYAIYAQTVFSNHQRLLLLGRDVSSKYTRRNQQEYELFSDYIEKTVSAKKGNYMVFFPSYKMLEDILSIFLVRTGDAYKILVQASNMKDADREEFLLEFEKKHETSMVAFCVLGGIFSEGIDLTKEKLIGAIVVGVGLPQIGNEREMIKEYFEETGRDGFSFAYLYPGMNKVIQAAGRVIRTTEDVGVIALLDDRFLKRSYRETFPREWSDYETISLPMLDAKLKEFWNEHSEYV